MASKLRKFYTDEKSCNERINNPSKEKVIIFDGMIIVNKINIKKFKIKTCADFAEVFVERILDESFGYDEVRVIFERYVKKF